MDFWLLATVKRQAGLTHDFVQARQKGIINEVCVYIPDFIYFFIFLPTKFHAGIFFSVLRTG